MILAVLLISMIGTAQINNNTKKLVVSSLIEFKLQNIKYYEDVKIFDMEGKFISEGIDLLTLCEGIYIVTAKNYESKKIRIN